MGMALHYGKNRLRLHTQKKLEMIAQAAIDY